MVQHVVAAWPELGQRTLEAGQWVLAWDNPESASYRAVLIYDYDQARRYNSNLCGTRMDEAFGMSVARAVKQFHHMGNVVYSDLIVHVIDDRSKVLTTLLDNGINGVTIIRPVWNSKRHYSALLINASAGLSDLPSDIAYYRHDHYRSLIYDFDTFYREATSIQRTYGKNRVQIINVNVADSDRLSLSDLITKKVLPNVRYRACAT